MKISHQNPRATSVSHSALLALGETALVSVGVLLVVVLVLIRLIGGN